MEIDPAYFAQAARRVEELEREMSAPGAASNPAVFKELVREHQRLSELGKAAEEWRRVKAMLAENAEVLADAAGDPELAEIARAEKEGTPGTIRASQPRSCRRRCR